MKNIYLGFFKFYQPKATGGGFLIFEWTLIVAEPVKKGPKEKNSETVTDRQKLEVYLCHGFEIQERYTGRSRKILDEKYRYRYMEEIGRYKET
jgi:hypothetical protein